MQARRVLGIDPGRRHVGYAVIDERLLTAGVWQFPPDVLPLVLPALVRQQAQTLLRRYQVDVLAIEDWVWYGRFVKEAPFVTRLIGALETLASQVLVVEYPADEWMRALMGYLPSLDPYGWERPSWKAQLRTEVGSRLHHQWPVMLHASAASAFHDSDAAGVALYAQAVQRTGCRLQDVSRRVPPRPRRRQQPHR